jgi:glycine cleavage system H protein
MPLKGEVIEVNSDIESDPESVNASPYEKGWMIKVKLDNPADADSLLTAEQYEAEVA